MVGLGFSSLALGFLQSRVGRYVAIAGAAALALVVIFARVYGAGRAAERVDAQARVLRGIADARKREHKLREDIHEEASDTGRSADSVIRDRLRNRWTRG